MKKGRKINNLLINPYVINGVVWLFVMLVYQLGWSGLCPTLSADMVAFLVITIAASLVAGVVTFYSDFVIFKPLKSLSFRSIYIWLGILMVMFVVEGAANGGFPLLGYLAGSTDLAYNEFGLPVVHIFVVNGLSCIALYSFYGIRSFREKNEEDKKKRRQLTYVILVIFLAFLLMFNRGAMMSIVVGIFFILILSCRRPFLVMSQLLLGGIGILFLFGVLGNIRMGDKMRGVILKMAKASTEFRSSNIPDEFFWGYIYIATPLANTQNTINHTGETIVDSEDVENLIKYEMLPEMVTKRLSGEDEKVKRSKRSVLLVDSLTAVSVYGRAYKYMGWGGMWSLFIFTMVFIYVNMKIVPKDSKWFIPILIEINLIVTMNLFDNMFIFMGQIPQLLMFVSVYWYQQATKHMKKFTFRTRSRV